jgi:hypothetical protein
VEVGGRCENGRMRIGLLKRKPLKIFGGLVNRTTAQTPSPWVAFASQSDVTKRSAIESKNEVEGRNGLAWSRSNLGDSNAVAAEN